MGLAEATPDASGACDVIERRTPLGVGARRASGQGCTILMNNIPRQACTGFATLLPINFEHHVG
jgi:hypothetical protein